jgi:NitT/TauT family transport system ATP-binding protein
LASSISVSKVTVAYPLPKTGKQLIALWQFSLDVQAGEFITVVGPSGCGKTSLLNAIAGLVRPAEGRILVDGQPVVRPGPDRAVVFQDYALFPWRSVRENIRFGMETDPLARRDAKRRMASVIDLVGLKGFEDSYPHQLSGGMQQRVGLARALVVEPKILLLDEPFAAVDAMTREVMQTELERIVATTHTTAILITHSIDEAILLGDRVVVATTRPGRIKKILPVELDRPRGGDGVKGDPRFLELREEIWHLLRDDAVQADAGA